MRRRSKSRYLELAAMLGLAVTLSPEIPLDIEPKKVKIRAPDKKPEFTKEELEWLQTLSKTEKKKAVKILKEKYSKRNKS